MAVRTLFLILLLLGLPGCRGSTSLVIRERDTWNEEPLVLDPAHVEQEALVLYELLERAHETGHAETSERKEIDVAYAYLRDISGIQEEVFYVEYREKVFFVGLRTA